MFKRCTNPKIWWAICRSTETHWSLHILTVRTSASTYTLYVWVRVRVSTVYMYSNGDWFVFAAGTVARRLSTEKPTADTTKSLSGRTGTYVRTSTKQWFTKCTTGSLLEQFGDLTNMFMFYVLLFSQDIMTRWTTGVAPRPTRTGRTSRAAAAWRAPARTSRSCATATAMTPTGGCKMAAGWRSRTICQWRSLAPETQVRRNQRHRSGRHHSTSFLKSYALLMRPTVSSCKSKWTINNKVLLCF